MSHPDKRLGKNRGGYFGEIIDLQGVLRDDLEAARKFGWEIERLAVSDGLELLAFHRAAKDQRRRFYLSAGIHGDEPAGPLAVRRLLQDNDWPEDASLWICPCLNPTGFPLNRRENADGVDLNRDYRDRQSAEVRSHINWLEKQPELDVTLCLHEDWESQGFYLYENGPADGRAVGTKIIDAVSRICPIDLSPVIEDRPALGGVIRPDLDPAKRPQWPEALYLLMHKTRRSYTLEAPSDYLLETRVAALVVASRVVLNES